MELSDGSVWRIWPADVAKTLQWLPTTEIDVVEIEHDICSHTLIDHARRVQRARDRRQR